MPITCPASGTRTRSGTHLRFLKQQLGWTRPKLRDPAAAGRWTWLVIAAYARPHLARHDVGKTVKHEEPKKKTRRQAG